MTTMTPSMSCDVIINKYSSDLDSMINIDFMQNFDKISDQEFKLWLSQEYIFLQELMRNFAACLLKCPNIRGLKTFSRGISFLRQNLDFLENKMGEYNIDLNKLDTKEETKNYIQFIRNIREDDYKQQVLVNWLVCYIYNQVIEKNNMPNIANDIVQPWRDIEFCEFLEELKNEVDRNMTFDKNLDNFLQNSLKNIKNLEINSWKMISKKN